MNIFDDRDKKDTQKQAGVQRASLPSAQKNALPAPLLLTKEGVAMADGKGGMKLITPSTTRQTTPIVKPKAAQSAGKQLVNTGTMVSDTGSNKRQVTPVTPRKSKAQQTVDNLPNIRAFGAGDYTGAGKLLERAAKTVKAGALSTAGSFAELAGQATPVTGEQHLGQFSGLGDLGRAVRENRETGEDINAITQRMETERRNRRAQQRQATFDSATRLFEKSAQAQEEAKEGAGTVGQFLVDMGVTGTQMLGDAVANLALPGSGLAMMGMRSYGQAANEARQQGKSEEQQFLAGLKSAGIETFTERMFGAFSKIYGKAGADELVEKLVTKLTGNKTGQALLTWIVNGAGEGVEEVTSDLLNPLADRMLKLDNGTGPLFTTEDAAQMGYDFLLGAAMGLVGGAGQLGRGVTQSRAQTAENAYYDDLRRNGLFSANGADNAQQASDAMGRAMPTEYVRTPRLVDADGLTYEQRQAAYRGAVPQNIENPRVGRLEMSSAPYNPTGADISTVYGNRYRNQVKENAIRRLGIADGRPAYLAAPNITKGGREYYVDVTKASLNKMLFTKGHEPLELERLLLVDNLEKAIDGSYWAESNGDRKGRTQINGFDTLRTSFYIDGIPYYADIKVKVVDKGDGQNPQNVAYYIEPEEITSIKRMDTSSPTGGRRAPNIFFRDNVSISDPSVSQNTQGVNAQDMRSGVRYAQLPRLVDANGLTYEQRQAQNVTVDPQSQNAAPQYSIKKTRTMPWQSQIASYYNGNLKSSDSLYLGTTGAEIGTRLGVADAPLYLPTSVITKAERDGGGSRSAHSMNRGDILALEDELRGSAAVVYNPARRALVYLTKGKASGKPLAVAVQVDTDLFGEQAHKITSIHNRGSMEGLLQNLGSDATVLVKNSSELNRLLPGTEIQSLQLLANVEFAGDNIPQEAAGVKYAQLPRLVDANGMDAQQRTAWLGALAQMPQEQRNQFETAAQIAQRFGATVQARAMQEGVQGSYQDGVISIDPSAADPVRQVLIHELTHHMERSGLYGRFSDAALRFVAENMGADVDTLRRAVIADYARAGVTLNEDGATREIVAKFAEEKLFTDEATVRRLLVQDRSLFQRIYDWLRDTVAKLQGTQEQRRLIDAQNLYEKALRQPETGTQGRATQLLYAGENARTADLNALTRAAEMEAGGTDAQTVRRATGWFRGMDGKWRFEIDDSGMEYRRDGDARLMEESGYRRLQELTDKWARNAENRGEPLTAEEAAESERLEGEYYDRAWAEKYELADFLRHSDLFEAYPALRHTSLVFKETMPGVNGYYDGSTDTIVLSDKLSGAPESTLVHEIQHAVQKAEGFTRGSSPEYWATRDYETGEVTQSLDREYNRVLRELDSKTRNKYLRYQEVNRAMENLENAEEGTPAAEKYVQLENISDRLYTELWGIPEFNRLLDLKRQIDTPSEVYDRFYKNTAGEIEARDAADRRGYTAEQRRQLRPDLGNEATVFADGGVGYFAMSAEEQAGVREQLRKNNDRLNAMDVVGRVNTRDYVQLDTGKAREKLVKELGRYGYTVNRPGLGEVQFSEREINNSLNYKEKSPAAEDARRTGFLVLRDVLKRGIEIDGHDKHKGRNYDTVTIAAPVEINGRRGNMAVVVKKTKGNRYKVHRILTPEGETFILPEMANAEMNTVGAVTNNSQSLGGSTPAINSASKFSIPASGGNVNTEKLSTGRSIEEMAGVDSGRTVQENGLYRRDTGDAMSEDAMSWQALYGGSDRMAPPEVTAEPVSAQDAAEQNAYMEQLARDENIIGDDPYTVSDAVYDAQLRRLERQEAPPERTVEQTTQADLDDLVRLYADQADPIGTREDRIRDTESMVTDHTTPERKSIREKAREAWSYFYRKMVDAGHSVSKVSEAVNDPYLYQFYNQARASASAGVSMIADAQTDVNARKVGESLNAIFSPIRQKGEDYYHEFQMYLFNLHNIDRMSLSQNKEQAVLEARAALREFDVENPEIRTDTEAQLRRLAEDPDPDTAALARQRMQLLRAVDRADAIKDKPVFGVDVTADVSRERVRRAQQAHPEFEEYRQQVRHYIDNLMQYRVDSGLMTQENADFLKRYYPNYVPTLRVTDGDAGAGRDRNAVRVGRTVGRAQGGTEQLVPLHEALGKQTMKVVREGSKNRFGQRMLDDYVSAGDSPAVHRYIKDAQEFDGSDFDPDTLNDVSSQPLAKDKTFTVFRDGKRWELTVDDTLFDALKALSPDAAESNTLTKAVRASNKLFKSLVTGYNPTFLVRNTVRDLQTAGLYTRDGKAFLRNYPKALAEIKNNGEYWQMYKALGGSYSSVFDYATGTVKEPTGRAGKLMARLESLNMATEQAPRLAEFMSVLEKGGVNSETLADALYAAADVTVNFGRAGTLGKVLNANLVPFLNPGIQGFDKMIRRVTETKGGREWAKLIGRAAVLGIAPTLINSLLYHDDEEWDDLRDSDKDTNYMFKLKDGIWLKIPKGRELSLLGITADRVSDAVRGQDVDLIATLQTMENQVAPANPLTSNIAMTLFNSALLNPKSPGRTWYGGDIENQRLQSYAPGQRYDSSTDVFSKAVGGALGISPKKLNYVLDQYSGVVGDFLLPILTPQAERGMFAKAFTTDAVTNNRVSGDFFDEADELTYARNGGDETAAVVSRFWSKQQSACSDLWKEIREVESSDLSDKEKRQKTRELKAVVTGIQKNALAVEESYRAAAEKYLRQGMEADEAYRAANKECFGAEYAIQTYNKDVYERAKSAKTNGVSYDDFYTYYFGTKDIKSTAQKSAATQKFEWMQNSGMDLTAQAEIYFADMASDKTLGQQAALETDAGITAEQFYQYKVLSSGMSKKAEKLQAIDSLDLTNAQKDALYYAEGWAQSTIGQAPWRGGYSGGYTGTSSGGGNPFLRTTSGYTGTAASDNPFVRAMQQRGMTQTAQTENPFVRAMQKREAAQTNPFLRGRG